MKETKYLLGLFILALVSCTSDSSTSGDPGASGQGGSLARFTIYNDYLYTLGEYNLHVFSIQQANDPVSVSTEDIRDGLETVFAKDGYLYIGSEFGMLIYDLATPDQPSFISEYEHVIACDPVVVKDNYAFVTLNSNNFWCGRHVNELQLIDISEKSNPKRIKTIQMEGPEGLGIRENLLFVCDDGLEVYNIENLPDIQFVEKFEIDAHDVIPTEESLLVIGEDGLRQYEYQQNSITLLSLINFKEEQQ